MSDTFINIPGDGVTSLNGLTGSVSLIAGSNITITPSGNTLTIASTGGGGGSGTVTSVSIVTANGFSGTVATPTTTPAITLTGTLSGDITGTLNATTLTATSNSTLTTLSALSLPYSQITGTPSVWLLTGNSGTTAGTDFLGTTDAQSLVFKTNSVEAMRIDQPTSRLFIGTTSSIGASNAGIQYADATTANRGQIKLHSFFNGTSIAGVSTLTSRSGTVGVNAAVVAGQDYSKWTAQAAATTPGSAPISGTFSFKANTVNSLTVTSDYHIQLTNLAGVLGDRLYLNSEGLLQLPGYSEGIAQFDASGNITSTTPSTSGNILTSNGTSWVSSPSNSITALTGDVTASGPGSSITTIAQTLTDRYVDLINGNDSNSGSTLHRWKTIQHAATVVAGLTSFNEPYTIHISGGTGNDIDVGTVTVPANVAYVADQLTQLTGNWVFPTTGVNDNITITNLIFLGSVTWLRNDISSVTLNVNNSVFGGGLVFKQAGTGAASIDAFNSTFVGMDVQLPSFGSFFSGCNFTAPATFEDSNSSAYYQFESGYIGTPISFAGGPFIYMAGVIADVPFGYTLTTSTTAKGTPTIQTDSGSVPPTISGPNTLYLASFSQHENYTPAVPANWVTPPTQVKQALDELAAKSSTILALPSNPSAGGAVSEALTVPGLLTTDTILSVTQMTQGGATRTSLPLIGWDTVVTNGLTAHWVADPGVGAVVLVAVKR